MELRTICWRNCGICCYFRKPEFFGPDTTRIEAFEILEYAKKHKIKYHKNGIEKIPEKIGEFFSEKLECLLNDKSLIDKTIPKIQKEILFIRYPTGKFPCVFLETKTKKCKIYQVRPKKCIELEECKIALVLYKLVKSNRITYRKVKDIYYFPGLDNLKLKQRIEKLDKIIEENKKIIYG